MDSPDERQLWVIGIRELVNKIDNMENIFNVQEVENIHRLITLYSNELVKVKRDLARLDTQQAEFQEVHSILECIIYVVNFQLLDGVPAEVSDGYTDRQTVHLLEVSNLISRQITLESRLSEMRFWLALQANNNGQQVNVTIVINEYYDFYPRLLTVANRELKITQLN